MAQGNTGYRRIVHKATHWWKHGKHKGAVELSVQTNREIQERQRKKRATVEMFSSVKEAFQAAKKR